MPEFLSPGVFVVQQPATGTPVVEGVSTSNAGFTGYTARGPENEARLVTSFGQFQKLFGSYTRESLTALMVALYFQNGGARAYVTRVVPADASAADAKLLSNYVGEVGDTHGTGAAVSGTINTNTGATPLQTQSLLLYWRAAGTPVVAQQAKLRDGTTNLVAVPGTLHYEGRIAVASLAALHKRLLRVVPGATTTITWLSATLTKTITIAAPVSGSISTATNGAGSSVQFDFRTGLFSLRIAVAETPDAGAISVTFTPAVGDPGQAAAAAIGAGANGTVNIVSDVLGVAGNDYTVTVVDSSAGIDHGVLVTWDGTNLVVDLAVVGNAIDPGVANNALNVAIAINAAAGADLTATHSGTGLSVLGAAEALKFFANGRDATSYFAIIDDGTNLVDSVGEAITGTGTRNLSTGVFSFTTHIAGVNIPNSVPYDGAEILADYTLQAWDLDPVSRGAWADQMRVSITGNTPSFNPALALHSHYNVSVELYNASLLGFETLESYEAISFDNPDDAKYFPSYINEVSTLLRVGGASFSDLPLQQLRGESLQRVIAGGDQTTPNKTIVNGVDSFLSAPIAKRSVSISYVSATDGLTKTITDNGAGFLIGSVGTGTNTINYTTGAFALVTADPIRSGSLVVMSFRLAPALTVTREQFADPAKGYTSGSNGTFDDVNYGRTQLTDPALQGAYQGIYAFDRIDTLLQLVVPDVIGDVAMMRDLLDYADNRELQPNGPDRFVILAGPETIQNAQDLADWVNFTFTRFSKYAAFYGPWVRVADPLAAGRSILVPSVGHLAGVYARTDSAINVAASPAGLETAQLNALLSLATLYARGEQDILTPARINALTSSQLTGNVVWGARTMATQSEWRYISAVRTLMFLCRSVYNSTQWVVFKNNNPTLWNRLKTQLDGFFSNLTAQGYFASSIPSEAYFVQVNDQNNTADTINAGQLFIDIGFAPTKPAEFVVFRVAQLSLAS